MSSHHFTMSDHAHHAHHFHHSHHAQPALPALTKPKSLTRQAMSATLHCLTGCAIGEVLGMVIGMALGWSTLATIALAVTLAFTFGFGLTMIPLRRSGMAWRQALKIAFAADAASVAIMEVVDNAIMLLIPGAMDAHLHEPLFWGSMILALAIALIAALPVNRWLIARGRGHAVMRAYHQH